MLAQLDGSLLSAELEAALARGKELDLDALVQEVLGGGVL